MKFSSRPHDSPASNRAAPRLGGRPGIRSEQPGLPVAGRATGTARIGGHRGGGRLAGNAMPDRKVPISAKTDGQPARAVQPADRRSVSPPVRPSSLRPAALPYIRQNLREAVLHRVWQHPAMPRPGKPRPVAPLSATPTGSHNPTASRFLRNEAPPRHARRRRAGPGCWLPTRAAQSRFPVRGLTFRPSDARQLPNSSGARRERRASTGSARPRSCVH